MRVLQINTVCGYGSTGRNCIELARMLSERGHECHIAYGQGETSFANAYKVGTVLENHLHNICSRLLGKQGYYSAHGTKNLVRYIEELQPDIIHLQNLHGNYLNLKILFEYLSKSSRPVIWTLHDCWAYTGKCVHYTDADCYKWKTHCGDCPQHKKYPPSLFFDRSKTMFADKKRWFTSVENMTIVPVSRWLAEEARQSFLGKYPIVPIYNWIDQTVFTPRDASFIRNARKRHGLSADAFVILGVSNAWNNRRGSGSASKLHDFCLLSEKLRPPMRLILVGKAEVPGCIPKHAIHIPYLHDIAELAAVYNAADVYVHLSMEDTFGKVIAEALACGTPAVAYDSTACAEVVGEGCGFVVEGRNIDQVYESTLEIQRTGKQAYSQRCVSFCEKNYNFQNNTAAHLDLYNMVLNP